MMNATAGAKTIKIALEEPSEREIKEMSLKTRRENTCIGKNQIYG